jgi:hypothetical protein
MAMSRRLGWAVLVGAGVLLGCLLSSYSITGAASADLSLDNSGEQQTEPVDPRETVGQLRELNAQMKELRTLLCSGKVRVVVVINPDHE